MITQEEARTFAAKWIAAWNSHNIEDIISHYHEDITFSSPLIAQIAGKADGRINGLEALKDYFTKGLAAYPELHFELYNAFAGVNTVVLHYKSVKNLVAAEVFELGAEGKVRRCTCNYREL